MKMHKTIERTPKGPYIMFKSLKQKKTNKMKNKE